MEKLKKKCLTLCSLLLWSYSKVLKWSSWAAVSKYVILIFKSSNLFISYCKLQIKLLDITLLIYTMAAQIELYLSSYIGQHLISNSNQSSRPQTQSVICVMNKVWIPLFVILTLGINVKFPIILCSTTNDIYKQ